MKSRNKASILLIDPALIQGWRDLVSLYPAELAVSLSFNYQNINQGIVYSDKVHSLIDRYHRDLDIDLLGSHCNKWSSCDRSEFIGFIEHEDSNTHVHLCWRLPPSISSSQFLERAEPVWRSKIVGSGSVCVKPIRDSGWAEYITKHIEAAIDIKPELFVASRFIKTKN